MTSPAIEALLSREIGLRVESIGGSALTAAVSTRMNALGVASVDEYAACVSASAAELRALIEEVVVTETWFFRDEDVFVALTRRALATRRAGGGPLRVLSLPCATGEEPYSIAIVLLDAGLSASDFVIHAVDVNGSAIEAARRGTYGRTSFRSVQSAGRMHYLERRNDGVRVADAARESVHFRQGNALGTGLAFGHGEFHVAFCRNLLIYLDASSRTRVLERLAHWLTDDGVLFAGHAEAVDAMGPLFRRDADAGTFAYAKKASKRTSTRPLAAPRSPRGAPVSSRARSVRPAPAAAPVAGVPPAASSPTLAQAKALADRGALDAAERACREHLAKGGAVADGYCLLGIVLQAKGDLRGASEAFTKALYLDRGHHEALVHVALLSEQRGDATAASNYRRRAEAIRNRRGSP